MPDRLPNLRVNGRQMERKTMFPRALLTVALVASMMSTGVSTLPAAQSENGVNENVTEAFPVIADDEVLLDTWVHRPQQDEPVPVILIISPYFSTEGSTAEAGGRAQERRFVEIFTDAGYAVALSSVRGTGFSGGCMQIGSHLEGSDHYTVVEALGDAPWSNGKVGMIGHSYSATTAQHAAVEAPPSLKTIVPVNGISEWWKYAFLGGVPFFHHGFITNTGYTSTSIVETIPPSSARICDETVELIHAELTGASNGVYTEHWKERDFASRVDEATAAVFYIHGLGDWNVKTNHMTPWTRGLQGNVPLKVWLGQWSHTYPDQPRSGWPDTSRVDFIDTLLRWFDHHLKGAENGIMDGAPVEFQTKQGLWLQDEQWPPTTTNEAMLHLGHGTLSQEPTEGVKAFTDTGAPIFHPHISDGGHYVSFVSEPFDETRYILGEARLELDLMHTAIRGQVVATIWLVSEDGNWQRINHGAWSYPLRESVEEEIPVTPGVPFRLDVPFLQQAHEIRPGQRIGLTLAGNDPRYAHAFTGEFWPDLQPVHSLGTTLVHLEDSHLILPVTTEVTPIVPQPEPV